MKLKIAPSILAADFSRLGEQVRDAERGGADQVHVDVMDGHFVPNLSMGPVVCEALKRVTDMPLDVHLMITNPEKYLESFVEAGANHISVHVEVDGDLHAMLAWLGERGIGRGLAVNPGTPAEAVFDYLPHVDMIVVMTVQPGFGGQKFMTDQMEKVAAIRAADASGKLDIQVDGGVDAETIRTCLDAGANVFVAGSSVFKPEDPGAAVAELRKCLEVNRTEP